MIEMINTFTKIRNALKVQKKSITVPVSKLVQEVLKILEKNNYILKVIPKEKSKTLIIELKYLEGGRPAITELHPISKPGLRVYRSYRNFKNFIGKKGILILSTSRGIMTDREARSKKIGGEIICKVV